MNFPTAQPRRSLWGPLPPTPLQLLLLLMTALSVLYTGGSQWDVPASWSDGSVVPTILPISLADFLNRCRLGLPFGGWLLAILGSHEMGHYLACRWHRVAATWPYFLPAPLIFLFGTFGAVIRIRSVIPNRRALFDIAIAGPLAGFVVSVAAIVVGVQAAVGFPESSVETDGGMGILFGLPWIAATLAEWLRPEEALQMNGVLGAGWAGLLVTTLNLFPAGQLDGGHISYAVSRRLHRWLSVAALLLAIISVEHALWLGQLPTYAVWVVVLAMMRDRHPRLMDETTTLGRSRTVLAFVALLIFVICFHWLPLQMTPLP